MRKAARSARSRVRVLLLAALRRQRAEADVPDCYYRDESGGIHVLL